MTIDSLQIYSTERSHARSIVHFVTGNDSAYVEGTLRGPFCKYSRTLPSTTPIREGKATVVDPCYWTPGLPFRYEISIAVETSSGVERREFLWGIRWCVPHQSHLLLDGRGYVIRAVAGDEDVDLEECRSLSSSLLAKRRLSADVYEAASEIGVLIVDTDTQIYSDDRSASSIALQPSVNVMRLHDQRSDALYFAAETEETAPTPDGANVLLRSESELTAPSKQANAAMPILVERHVARDTTANMRRACDTLQRDLAQIGQFAGYLISSQS